MRKPALSHLPELDGLRGLAIGLVLLFHFFVLLWPNGFTLGWIGVDLFFVLSGFLITRILLETREAPHYYRNFFFRRMLRIFPLYYGLLIVVFLLAPLVFGAGYDERFGVARDHQAWYWLYGQNILAGFYGWDKAGPLGYLWSLAVEEHFYLFWPWIIYKASERTIYGLSAGFVLLSIALRNAFLAWGLDVFPGYTFTFTRTDGLVLGSCLATYLHFRGAGRPGTERPVALLRAARLGLLGGGLFLTGIILTEKVQLHEVIFSRIGFTINAVFFTSVLALLLFAAPGGVFRRFFRTAPMRALGKYSYGIYVFHFVILELVEPSFIDFTNREIYFRLFRWTGLEAPWQVAILTARTLCLLAVFALSWLSFHFYEKPWLRLKRYFELDARPTDSVLPAVQPTAPAPTPRRD